MVTASGKELGQLSSLYLGEICKRRAVRGGDYKSLADLTTPWGQGDCFQAPVLAVGA